MIAALRRLIARRALRRTTAVHIRCCGGRCTTAGAARLARLAPVRLPRQRTPGGS